ncbi:hypothetical protein KEM55_008361, partial [Ascosphaera atra]
EEVNRRGDELADAMRAHMSACDILNSPRFAVGRPRPMPTTPTPRRGRKRMRHDEPVEEEAPANANDDTMAAADEVIDLEQDNMEDGENDGYNDNGNDDDNVDDDQGAVGDEAEMGHDFEEPPAAELHDNFDDDILYDD